MPQPLGAALRVGTGTAGAPTRNTEAARLLAFLRAQVGSVSTAALVQRPRTPYDWEDFVKLYYSPISTFSLKTLTALNEKAVAAERIVVDLSSADARAAYKKKYPLGRVPLLELEDGYLIPESTTIIEYLEGHFDSGTPLIPAEKDAARRVRFFDRQFDLYFLDPFAKIFFDGRRPEGERDARGVASAKSTLDIVYAYMDHHMEKRTWATGEDFTMADCAAAPALTYLRMVYPYDKYKNLGAYAGRLAERPSFAKAFAEAAPLLAKLG